MHEKLRLSKEKCHWHPPVKFLFDYLSKFKVHAQMPYGGKLWPRVRCLMNLTRVKNLVTLRKSKVIYIQRKHHRGSKLQDSEVLLLCPTGLHTALNRIMRIFLTYLFSPGNFEFSKIVRVCNYLSLGIGNYIL